MLAKLKEECLGNEPVLFQGLQLEGGDGTEVLDGIQATFLETINLTQQHLHLRFDNLLGVNKSADARGVINAFRVFHHDAWPSEKRELLTYGAKEIQLLTQWYSDLLSEDSDCDTEKIQDEWRSLKKIVANSFSDKVYCDVYAILLEKEPYKTNLCNILHLVEILLTLPISSANCERAFSAQKRIKSATRSSLSTSRLSDLILISTEGPELAEFDPKPSVQRWLDSTSAPRRPFAKSWDTPIVEA